MLWIDLISVSAEMYLGFVSLLLIVICAIGKEAELKRAHLISLAALLGTVLIIVGNSTRGIIVSFNNLIIIDDYIVYMKVLTILSAFFTLFITQDFFKNKKNNFNKMPFELPIMILLSTIGMLFMISANDLLTVYIGIEIYSLPLYALLAMNKNDRNAAEASVKYFTLGTLSSGMLLYGISLIYVFSSTTNFDLIQKLLSAENVTPSLGILVGFVLIVSGLLFKLSLFPFHLWQVHIFKKSHPSIKNFLSIAPKVATASVLIKLFAGPFHALLFYWQDLLFFIALASIFLSSIQTIRLKNMKEILAYLTIGHMGQILLGVAAGSAEGVRTSLLYLGLYVAVTIGMLSCLTNLKRKDSDNISIDSLRGLSAKRPYLSAFITFFCMASVGLPPLALFFGKLYILVSVLNAGFVFYASLGIIANMLGTIFCFRVIKAIYFETAPLKKGKDEAGFSANFAIGLSSFVIILFMLFPSIFIDEAAHATTSLMAFIQ
ncbi:MAG: NADH-quinone oxidoreductase subunit N [Alphaproteobacteria bacterium]